MKHIYVGPMIIEKCEVCQQSGYAREQHFFNACSDPCDNDKGPCACGAWHQPSDFDSVANAANGAGPI